MQKPQSRKFLRQTRGHVTDDDEETSRFTEMSRDQRACDLEKKKIIIKKLCRNEYLEGIIMRVRWSRYRRSTLSTISTPKTRNEFSSGEEVLPRASDHHRTNVVVTSAPRDSRTEFPLPPHRPNFVTAAVNQTPINQVSDRLLFSSPRRSRNNHKPSFYYCINMKISSTERGWSAANVYLSFRLHYTLDSIQKESSEPSADNKGPK